MFFINFLKNDIKSNSREEKALNFANITFDNNESQNM